MKYHGQEVTVAISQDSEAEIFSPLQSLFDTAIKKIPQMHGQGFEEFLSVGINSMYWVELLGWISILLLLSCYCFKRENSLQPSTSNDAEPALLSESEAPPLSRLSHNIYGVESIVLDKGLHYAIPEA